MGIFSTFANKRSGIYYAALMLSSLCLLIPAFYNHFPLVNPDTATYIESGFIPDMPSDRPITYGLLIRLFTLNGISLWLVVFAQAYILSWVIFRVIKNLAGENYVRPALLMVSLLSLGSSLSWIASQVQPDVFTPIAFLCITLILMNKENRRTNVLLYTLFFFAVAVHLSHPVLMFASLAFLFIFSKLYRGYKDGRPSRKLATLFILSVVALITMVTPLSKSKHIFFMGSLLEKGVLKPYLDHQCASRSYKLCAYKDVLPKKADDFWWDPQSPLNKMGDWKSVAPEFNEIIHDIFSKPSYIRLYAYGTFRQAAWQLVTVNIGDGNQSFPPGAFVNRTVAKYFPGEIGGFDNAVQNQKPMMDSLAIPNKIFGYITAVCLLGLVFFMLRWRRLASEMKLVLIVCLAGILLNCLDCAAFGTINGRYGCKMIWLIPFCLMACMVHGNFLRPAMTNK